jgi:preprotein translocase subunit SecA
MFGLGALKRLLGDDHGKALLRAQKAVATVGSFEPAYQALTDEQIKAKTAEFKTRAQSAQDTSQVLDTLLPEAFALVREASRRTLGQRHYDVQLVGGAVIHQGGIAEMRTGEGKTLVATLPVYLNALAGKGVHVVTVNDYLSRRDAVWMGQVYDALGLTVGVIGHEQSFVYDTAHVSPTEEPTKDEERDTTGGFHVVHEFLRPCTRREAYEADITYGTNSEFGFDYLRDNIALQPDQLRQRGHAFAVVDEIDSILIDEARTPLIISAPAQDAEKLYTQFAALAQTLQKDVDYTVDEKLRAVQITESGIDKAEAALGVENIYTDAGIKYVHHLETAVRAKALFERDTNYVVKDGEVIIVDEFTGRMQPGRRWSEGLHQAVEAKEGVKIQQESRTFASITYQNYFRLYDKLAGMTGTARTSSEEFYKVYGLNTVEVPTNKPVARVDRDDLIFQTETGKWQALVRRVRDAHDKGQPVLIGTVSVEKNELLSAYLSREGVPHQMLNAKNHEREGEIIAQAGQSGAVTLATNMAGRGVDIKLGGATASAHDADTIRALGGLLVIGTERHEARRIDNQLRGRSGRQGDPGETQFFVSLDDPLMRIFAGDTIKTMMGRFGIPEDEPIQNRMITRSLEGAQQKIEGFHFDSRKQVLAYDDVLNLQRESWYARRRMLLTGADTEVDAALTELCAPYSEVAEALEAKKQELGEALIPAARRMMLQTLDMLWVEHLEAMDYLRSSVNLRAYGQRDPLVEYKREGLNLFRTAEASYVDHVCNLVPKLQGQMFVRAESQKLTEGMQPDENTDPVASARPAVQDASHVPAHASNEPNRNDPCPCGSGKKYKKCGLINAPEHMHAGGQVRLDVKVGG